MKTDLQHLRNTFTSTDKNIFDITGECFGRRYVNFRSSCLHKRLKCTVVHNLKRTLVLGHPADKFRPGILISMIFG